MNQTVKIIGFYGGYFDKPGVGKTTAANILVKNFNFHLCHISSNVEEIAKKLTGWNGKKDAKGIECLVRMCISGKSIHPNYWINLAIASIPKFTNKIVFDDVWFLNEYKIIKSLGGTIVLIKRHECHSCPDKMAWGFDPDFIINNDGDLDNLEKKVCDFAKK